MNFTGYINLFQLNGVELLTVNGKTCIVIPTNSNNLQVQRNEKTGALSCSLGIKADEVGEGYRDKEREAHRYDPSWDESKLTSHQLIRTYNKDYRERLFARLRELMTKELTEAQIVERMGKVLRRDGSEGVASMDNARGWDKLLWQELDRRSRMGRLSAVPQRTTTANVTVTPQSVNAQGVDWQQMAQQTVNDDLPF